MDVLFLILGAFSIGVGLLAKNFYVADVLSGTGYKQKRSRWSGRLICILVGLGFMAAAIKGLIENR
jgi:hypothetical protein